MVFKESVIAKFLVLFPMALGLSWLAFGSVLMVASSGLLVDAYGIKLEGQFASSIVGQFPGVPLPLGELNSQGAAVIGLSITVLGLDMLLVGLGLWTRNKLARWLAIVIFGLAAYFDFVQFLLLGLLGAPTSTIGIAVNSLMVYTLLKCKIWFRN